VVEGPEIAAGSYTLSWVGGGTGRINTTSGASPLTVALPANTNVSVVVPTTATDVQLEAGSVATPFERRPLGLELSLCQRFYNKVNFSVLQYSMSAGAYSSTWVSFPPMRAVPATTLGVELNPGSVGNAAVGYISTNGCRVQGTSAGAGVNTDFSGYVLLTAEL
jgi:hypothetical protein